MDSKVKLGNVSAVPEGRGIIVQLPNGRAIALFKVKGEVFALDNTCPHEGGPLGDGALTDYQVQCPWHAWDFDVRTGYCLNNPGQDAEHIAIEVVGDEIFLK